MRKKCKSSILKAIKKKLFAEDFDSSPVCCYRHIAYCCFTVYEKHKILIEYQDNIQVFQKMVTSSPVCNTYQQANSILVTLNKNGQTENIMYFKFFTTLWEDKIASDSKTFSEYVLAYKEKGAEEIDQIYYFTGDFNGLENLSAEELIKETRGSVQLWSK